MDFNLNYLPSPGDIQLISTPYEHHETQCKSQKAFKGSGKKRRYTQPSISPMVGNRTSFRESRLREAAAYNNTEKIRQILLDYRVNPNAADPLGRTSLHIAASRGFADAVSCLLQAGADVNAEDKLGNTPIHLAVYTGSAETVRLLVEAGAHLGRTKDLRYTPLQLAESKYTMIQRYGSYKRQDSSHQIFQIIEFMKEAAKGKVPEVDELASKVSQLGIKEKE